MLEDIKKQLIDNPEALKKLLEHYEFGNVRIHGDRYISFGHDADSSPKSVNIRLENNRFVYVTDYSRNINKDIFGYIIELRDTTFKDVLKTIKGILGITGFETYYHKVGAFGGFYDNIRSRKTNQQLKTYPEEILDEYEKVGNIKFLKDHISLEAQKYFQILFDTSNNGIVIPIRNQTADLIGVKIRCNYDSNDVFFQKYWYKVPCSMSQTLFGYCQNYSYLTDNDILVFESEKGVMQAYTYGYRNAVGLGSGSISTKQVKMLLELHPKSIIFMHDQGYSFDQMSKNMNIVQSYTRYMDVPIKYWDWSLRDYPSKVSATDMGEETFKYILENEIKDFNEEDDDNDDWLS